MEGYGNPAFVDKRSSGEQSCHHDHFYFISLNMRPHIVHHLLNPINFYSQCFLNPDRLGKVTDSINDGVSSLASQINTLAHKVGMPKNTVEPISKSTYQSPLAPSTSYPIAPPSVSTYSSSGQRWPRLLSFCV
jgi:hypothetical protein